MDEKLPELMKELLSACNASTATSPEYCSKKLSDLNFECSSKASAGDRYLIDVELGAPKQSLFEIKHKQLQKKKLDVLPKYIEMLYHIKQDKSLASVLGKSAGKSGHLNATLNSSSASFLESSSVKDETVSMVPQVQNKLFKYVGQIQARKSTDSEEAKVYTSPVSRRRPFLSQDFVFGLNNYYPSPSFDGLSPQLKEFDLVSDVLSCMLGCSGKYITVKPATEIYGLPSFSIPENADIQSKNMLVKILPVAAHYSVISRFLSEKQLPNCGRINQALAAAINSLMTDYRVFVVQMETLLNQQQLTLEKLCYQAYLAVHPVSILSKITQKMGKLKIYGGETLSVLYEEMLMTAADAQSTKICQYLLKSASVPFFVSLEKWINKGRVFDPHNEFMIKDNAVSENSSFLNKSESYYDEFWNSCYLIQEKFVPTFLEKVSEKILRTGKYLNVIRLCKNKKVKEMLPPPIEGLTYDTYDQTYLKAIDKAYDFASSALLKLMMEEFDLVNRFKSAKKYFMLEQGDFLVLLMDSCEAELLKPIGDVVPTRLELLLELAVRLCSGAKNDPYKDDICMDLHSHQFYFQLKRLFHKGVLEEAESKKEQTSQIGLEAFSIGLKVKWPMSLVFNFRVLVFYQMIFRLLLVCKHNERLLCRVWMYDKGVKMLDKQSRQGYLKAFSLRQRMLFFIQNFAFYITEEVIEPNFNIFMKELSKAKDIDCVLQLHEQYLEKSINECMLTNLSLLENIKLMLSKCTEFCDFILKQPSSLTDANFNVNISSFEETVNKLDASFNQLLLNFLEQINGYGQEEQFRKISNVFLRENFNGFYDEELGINETQNRSMEQ